MTDSIILIDAASDALTVSWSPVEGAKTYQLEYKKNDDEEFALLSEKLTQTQARKRNLSGSGGFKFRVASDNEPSKWMTHAEPFQLIPEESKRLAAPAVSHSGANQALQISWEGGQEGEAYEIQMRENSGGDPWKTIAPSFKGIQVRKKNLISTKGYQFRVKRADDDEFSLASTSVVARSLSPGMKRWFSSLEDGTLIRRGADKPIPLADAIGGKEFVLFYASAHWCPPCRQFTPMLANWYSQNSLAAEVVFISCDHDEAGFRSYLNASHPWLAVDYDDDAREALLGDIRVQGIPRLVVLDAATGSIVVDNAVGQSLDVATWRNMVAAKRK